MEEHGCCPDQSTYDTLIKGFLHNNQVKRALQVIDVMAAKGFQADAQTASLVLDLLAHDQVDKSFKDWLQNFVKH